MTPRATGMPNSFDVIVVGVGSMGSAACYHLARRGVRVLGLDRYDVPNAMGSAHGQSRVVRQAYYEHPDYVPLLRRSYQLWDELAAETGQDVIHVTGGLMIGPPGAEVVDGSLRSAVQHGLPHEMLDAAEAMRRFPQFRLPDDYRVLHDHRAGLVRPERAVAGHAELARRHGAELHGREAVTDWSAGDGGVVVRTARGEYAAATVVLCGGAWTDLLVRDLGVPLTVTRQPQVWVSPRRPDRFELGRMPVWIMEHRDGSNHYGFPILPDAPGLKVATHVRSAPEADVEAVDRSARPSDEAAVRPVLRDHLPDADGPVLAVRVCLYTNSPDLHFVIDRHPLHPNVVLACGFSGHGFKCASGVGQVLAELATDGRSTLPVEFLGLGRFVGAAV